MSTQTGQLKKEGFLLCICAVIAVFHSGCAGVQSALDPAGPQAQRIGGLWRLLFWTCSIVFLLVMAALTHAVWRGRAREAADNSAETERRTTMLVAGAIALSIVILFVFLIADFRVGRATTTFPSSAVKIKVTGYQWWWDFEYQDEVASQLVRVSNELHIPTGRPVQFDLTSRDVIHSFWVPNLHGKIDAMPGYQTGIWLQADRTGKYRGQCAEYCGHQHAHMAFWVIAEAPEQFAAWRENQRRPAVQPMTAEQQRGQQVFLTRTCVMCHQIRGTIAGGRSAPDLTHLASRQTIAAGTLAINRNNLRGWITNPQHYKPGNKMPPHKFSEEELNALLSYLESLK
jgi:cytochrome c oxidase subunit II